MHQFQGNTHFSYTDRVKPHWSNTAQALAFCLRVESEPLPKVFPVTAATKHLHDVSRQKKNESDRPNQIVEQPDHFSFSRKSTSVAPYRRARRKLQFECGGSFSWGRFSSMNTP